MLSNVYLKTLRDMRRPLFWWVAGLFLFTLYFVTLYPSIEEASADMQSYIDSLPDSFKAMFGGNALDLSTFEGFLTMELLSMFYPIMILAFAVSYGAGLIGSEEESGTLEILLATPLPRWRVMLSKFGALITFTLIVLLAVWLGIAGGVLAVDIETDLGNLLAGVMNMAPLALVFAALAFCLTGLRGSRGTALGLTLAVAAITYLVHTLSEVTNVPAWMQKLSPWYWYNGVYALSEGVDPLNVALLLGVTLLLVALGMWGFERRDLGV